MHPRAAGAAATHAMHLPPPFLPSPPLAPPSLHASLMLNNAACPQHAVLSKGNAILSRSDKPSSAAPRSDVALLPLHQRHHTSFTNSPAVLLPQPYPATPTPPLPPKSIHKRLQRAPGQALPSAAATPSPPAAAATAATAAATSPLAQPRVVLSPLKASLIVQPAARVASPAEVARVAAAAAVAAEQVSRAGLSLMQLRSPGHEKLPAVERRQQQDDESGMHAQAERPRSSALAAAASASRLLQELDSSGGGVSSGEVGGDRLRERAAAGAAAVEVTSREQLLQWMKVCAGGGCAVGA